MWLPGWLAVRVRSAAARPTGRCTGCSWWCRTGLPCPAPCSTSGAARRRARMRSTAAAGQPSPAELGATDTPVEAHVVIAGHGPVAEPVGSKEGWLARGLPRCLIGRRRKADRDTLIRDRAGAALAHPALLRVGAP